MKSPFLIRLWYLVWALAWLNPFGLIQCILDLRFLATRSLPASVYRSHTVYA